MRREAAFDSSFWVHAVYPDLVDFLLADYTLLCPTAVERKLGRDNPTSLRLKALRTDNAIQSATPRTEQITLYGKGYEKGKKPYNDSDCQAYRRGVYSVAATLYPQKDQSDTIPCSACNTPRETRTAPVCCWRVSGGAGIPE